MIDPISDPWFLVFMEDQVFTQDPWTQEFGNSCQSPTVDLKFFFFTVHAFCGRVFVASTRFLNGFIFSIKSEKSLQQNVSFAHTGNNFDLPP